VPTGRVKWFDRKKGFGFIIGPVGQDVFVHYTHIIRVGFKFLRENEPVKYHLLHSDKGWQARGVEPVSEAMVDDNAVADADHYEEPLTVDEVDTPRPVTASEPAAPAEDTPVQVPRSGGYVGAPVLAEAS